MAAYRDNEDPEGPVAGSAARDPYLDLPDNLLQAFAEADMISWETYYDVIARRRGVDPKALYNPWVYVAREDRS